MTIDPETGFLYFAGQIRYIAVNSILPDSVNALHGSEEILVFSLFPNGTTNFINMVGSESSDIPVGINFIETNNTVMITGYTSS